MPERWTLPACDTCGAEGIIFDHAWVHGDQRLDHDHTFVLPKGQDVTEPDPTKGFVHPILGEIVGYASLEEFEAAVAVWDEAHADEPSPMLEDARRLANRPPPDNCTCGNETDPNRFAHDLDCPYWIGDADES